MTKQSKVREDWYTLPGMPISPFIQITPEQAFFIAEQAAKSALNQEREYLALFDDIKIERLGKKFVADYLGMSPSWLNDQEKAGKIKFIREDGKHPYIIKRAFIEACRENKWI